MNKHRPRGWFATLAPGILLAATGVGAGDLMTASFAGSNLGVTVLWAVIVGAGMKWALTEGLARWQMGTGTTLLAGWTRHLRIHWLFLAYLVIWSFSVAGALIGACGVAGHALLPLDKVAFLSWLHEDPATRSRIAWGIAHSIAGVVLVRVGGFKLFARFMSVCVAVMFAAVVYCAVRILPEVSWQYGGAAAVRPGDGGQDPLQWTLALIGGVGGTVTLLSYGYWIREQQRDGVAGLRNCRLDLALGYTMTAVFGVGMVIIASTIPNLEGRGASLALTLAERLRPLVGPVGAFVFLLGFWGAVFSSLLGVWQSVPYLFADFLHEVRQRGSPNEPAADHTDSRPYKAFLFYLAVPPIVLLWFKISLVQLTYALLGAAFLPMLALTLLILNNRPAWVRRPFRNGWLINAVLVLTLVFFTWTGILSAKATLGKIGAGDGAPVASRPAKVANPPK